MLMVVLVLAGLVLTLVTTWFVWEYAHLKTTGWFSLITCWIGWYLSFSCVLLIPVDIVTTLCVDKADDPMSCSDAILGIDFYALQAMWGVVYWVSYVGTWVLFPVLQSYVCAGEFTFFDKMKSAFKENLIFYAAAGVVGGIFLIILIVKSGFGLLELKELGKSCGNAWGLFLLLAFVSYGLVEIPKLFWRKANRALRLKSLQFEIVGLKDNLLKSKTKYEGILKLVKRYEETVKPGDPFYKHVQTILKKCPPEYQDAFYGEGDAVLQYDKLVQLHKDVMWGEYDLRKDYALYDTCAREAIKLESYIKSARNPEHKLEPCPWDKPRTHRFARQVDVMEWWWRVWLQPIAFRAGTVVCSMAALVIVWSECLFAVKTVNLSIISLLVEVTAVDYNLLAIVSFSTILYMSYCAFWSLFQLHIWGYFRMLPHHQTEGNSMLFCAAYLCRLGTPMAYNFLLMAKLEHSALVEILQPPGDILTPLLGDLVPLYFPIILLIFVIFNLFNLYTRFLGMFCSKRFQRFTYDEDFSDDKIEDGRSIISKEREIREQGGDPTAIMRPNFERPTHAKKATGGIFGGIKSVFGGGDKNEQTSKSSQLPRSGSVGNSLSDGLKKGTSNSHSVPTTPSSFSSSSSSRPNSTTSFLPSSTSSPNTGHVSISIGKPSFSSTSNSGGGGSRPSGNSSSSTTRKSFF